MSEFEDAQNFCVNWVFLANTSCKPVQNSTYCICIRTLSHPVFQDVLFLFLFINQMPLFSLPYSHLFLGSPVPSYSPLHQRLAGSRPCYSASDSQCCFYFYLAILLYPLYNLWNINIPSMLKVKKIFSFEAKIAL
jgi:hypothetical protein